MTIQGVDFSDPKLPTSLLTEHSIAFACRYISVPGDAKNLTPTEAADRAKAGIKIVTCFETRATRALDGYQAGVDDAKAADIQSRALGQPQTYPVYYAVDFSVLPNRMDDVVRYFQGLRAGSQHFRVGVYGSFDVVERLYDAVVADYFWQTYAWSSSRWSAHADIRQYKNGVDWEGHQVDLDEAMLDEYGGWFPGGFAVPGAPTAPPSIGQTGQTDWMKIIMDRLPNLQVGAKDPIGGQWFVRRVQALLQDVASIHVGPLDGDFGPNTELGVKAFQRARHLTADGIVGPHTWAYLVTGANV